MGEAKRRKEALQVQSLADAHHIGKAFQEFGAAIRQFLAMEMIQEYTGQRPRYEISPLLASMLAIAGSIYPRRF